MLVLRVPYIAVAMHLFYTSERLWEEHGAYVPPVWHTQGLQPLRVPYSPGAYAPEIHVYTSTCLHVLHSRCHAGALIADGRAGSRRVSGSRAGRREKMPREWAHLLPQHPGKTLDHVGIWLRYTSRTRCCCCCLREPIDVLPVSALGMSPVLKECSCQSGSVRIETVPVDTGNDVIWTAIRAGHHAE